MIKILCNKDGVVYHYGADEYTIMQNNVTAKINNRATETFGDLFEGNAQIFEVEESAIPGKVQFRYIYNGTDFVKNNQFYAQTEENIQKLYGVLAINPTELGTVNVDAKVQSTIELIKSTPKENLDVFNLSEDVLSGLNLIDIDNTELSDLDKELKKKAQRYIAKLKARYRIEAEVGDIYDLLADTNKQVNLLTGLLLRLYVKVTKNIPIPETIQLGYDDFALMYISAVDEGGYKDRADIEDPQVMIPNLMEANVNIASITQGYKETLDYIEAS